jgi:hypothetical protein
LSDVQQVLAGELLLRIDGRVAVILKAEPLPDDALVVANEGGKLARAP